MSTLMLSLICLLSCVSLWAQARPSGSLAILPLHSPSRGMWLPPRGAVEEALGKRLAQLPGVQVLPMDPAPLDLKREGVPEAGTLSLREAVQSGKRLGADHVVFGGWVGHATTRRPQGMKATLDMERDTHDSSVQIRLHFVRVSDGKVWKALSVLGRSPSHAISQKDAVAGALEDAVEAIGKALDVGAQ